MSNLQKQRAHFHQDYWIKGPADHYVKSYGRFDAVINAGPDVQYMMSNGTRGKDAFAASPSNFAGPVKAARGLIFWNASMEFHKRYE